MPDYDNEITEFLSLPENIKSVLEIEQYTDRVRKFIRQRFWDDTFNRINNSIELDKIIGLTRCDDVNEEYASIQIPADPDDKNEKFFIKISIQIQTTNRNKSIISHGLLRSREQGDAPSKIEDNEHYKKIKAKLEANGFVTTNSWWLGLKENDLNLYSDDFLCQIADKQTTDKYSTDLAQAFIKMIKDFNDDIIKINDILLENSKATP